MSPEDPATPTLMDCPECGLPGEMTDRFVLDGAPCPVEHVKLVCVDGHWFITPVDFLPRAQQHLMTAPAPTRTEVSAIRKSRADRLMAQLKDVWDELDEAERQTFELQTGGPRRGKR